MHESMKKVKDLGHKPMRKPFTELGQRSVFPEASIGARTFPHHSQSNKSWLKALPYWLLFSDTKAKTSCQTVSVFAALCRPVLIVTNQMSHKLILFENNVNV